MQYNNVEINNNEMAFDRLTVEERLKFLDAGAEALLNDDFEGAEKVLKMFKISKGMKNVLLAGLGEEEIQKMIDKGLVFED